MERRIYMSDKELDRVQILKDLGNVEEASSKKPFSCRRSNA